MKLEQILQLIPGERAWKAADRACGADALTGAAHYDKIRDAGPTWAEIDEEAMMNALEVLPPRYFPGGFAVSEAVCDNREGRTMYLCVVTRGDRYFTRYATIRNDLNQELA